MAVKSSTPSNADWWARLIGVGSLVVAVLGIYVANKSAPDYYASPHQLRYTVSEANRLRDDRPLSGHLTVKISNSATTPARNVRLVISTISSNPEITSDQKYEIQDAPYGGKIVTVERVPAGGTATVDVFEIVEQYPPNFGYSTLGGPALKYQYFAVVRDVQTEFGSVPCAYEFCMRHVLPLPDESVESVNVVPPALMKEVQDALKKQFPAFEPVE